MTDDIVNSGSLLPEEQLRVAAARTVADWMNIYIEVVLRTLEKITGEEIQGQLYEKFRGETIPRLRRIVRDFEAAGLTIYDEIEVEGIHLIPGHRPLWEDPSRPEAKFIWPDGSELRFQGESAISAVGFFEFWAKHQIPITGVKGGQRRIITPGSTEEQSYFTAKERDQRGEDPNG